MDPELEELPTDLLRGLDFRITKTSKGGYADYNTSKWSRKESALTEAEQAALAAHGLFTLSDFLPKKPTEVARSLGSILPTSRRSGSICFIFIGARCR